MNPIASTGQAIELIRLTVGPAQQPDFLTDRPNVDAFISTLPGFVSTVPIERRSPTSRPKSVINVSAAAKWLGSKNTLLFVLPTKPGCQYRSNLTLSDLQESPLQDYLAIQ